MTDLIDNDTIIEIAQSFWGAFLPDDAELLPGFALPETEDIRARVEISGSWHGSVELSCSTAVARHVASALFAQSEASLTEAELYDAVGELVNVVGGNIKSILEPPTELSIPSVNDDSEWRFGSELECEVLLSWAGEPLIVRIWRRAEPVG
jgi:chemotaxis protein CheX